MEHVQFHDESSQIDETLRMHYINTQKIINNLDITVGRRFASYAVIRRSNRDTYDLRVSRQFVTDLFKRANDIAEYLGINSDVDHAPDTIAFAHRPLIGHKVSFYVYLGYDQDEVTIILKYTYAGNSYTQQWLSTRKNDENVHYLLSFIITELDNKQRTLTCWKNVYDSILIYSALLIICSVQYLIWLWYHTSVETSTMWPTTIYIDSATSMMISIGLFYVCWQFGLRALLRSVESNTSRGLLIDSVYLYLIGFVLCFYKAFNTAELSHDERNAEVATLVRYESLIGSECPGFNFTSYYYDIHYPTLIDVIKACITAD